MGGMTVVVEKSTVGRAILNKEAPLNEYAYLHICCPPPKLAAGSFVFRKIIFAEYRRY